ncbi:hypothetical protein Q5R05_09425 (plasmid) [Leuconostoc carnosum]|nr:hypothetical protein [Leuconostoc carnosum]WLC98745.1 hypothetical protein Q5R05_09425 [Leuconostoc carnosum]
MEYKKLTLSEKLNIIRAGVLGANDGIIGGAGVILGITLVRLPIIQSSL